VHNGRDLGRVSGRADPTSSPAACRPRSDSAGVDGKIRSAPDPDDDCFLECALAAEAEYIVTGNVRHFPKDYEAIAIVTPRQLLQRVVVDKP
jgi:predicted nucleic acid-binding protein